MSYAAQTPRCPLLVDHPAIVAIARRVQRIRVGRIVPGIALLCQEWVSMSERKQP